MSPTKTPPPARGHLIRLWASCAALLIALVGCEAAPPTPHDDLPGPRVAFALDAAPPTTAWLDHPWPSLARRRPDGRLDGAALPNPLGVALATGLQDIVSDLDGDSQVPVIYLRFDGPLATRDADAVIPASKDAPLQLFDLDDDDAPAIAVVAAVLPPDAYAPATTLAVAPRPGLVLAPKRRYALVALRTLGDATGAPLGVPGGLRDLLAERQPPTPPWAAPLRAPFRRLRAALKARGVADGDVAAATILHTGDATAALYAVSELVRQRHPRDLGPFSLDPDDGASHERFCELRGAITLPQFQLGAPPFATQGLFARGADGAPVPQRDESVPVVLTLPKRPMPATGWPAVLFLHGSGGRAAQVVDRGPQQGDPPTPQKGKGPAEWLAAHGVAAIGVALPINPERLPGAASTAYLPLGNIAALRDNVRQGLVEQRLLIDAVLRLRLDPAALAGCAGPTLPAGVAAHQLDPQRLGLMGQSQGGHYALLLAAIEPRLRVVVPTGAGAQWSRSILWSSKVPVASLIAALMQTAAPLTWLHPVMSTLQTALEPIEPLVAARRIARAPPEAAPRDVLLPMGQGDTFYPEPIFDALALGLGLPQVGAAVWPSLQQALALAGLDGVLPYPQQAGQGQGARQATLVAVQHPGDGVHDAHGVVYDDAGLRAQVSCFFASAFRDGVATLAAPSATSEVCPEP